MGSQKIKCSCRNIKLSTFPKALPIALKINYKLLTFTYKSHMTRSLLPSLILSHTSFPLCHYTPTTPASLFF